MVSLVEQHGREAIVGKAYQEYVRELDDNLLKFVEFDIHQGIPDRRAECLNAFSSDRMPWNAIREHCSAY